MSKFKLELALVELILTPSSPLNMSCLSSTHCLTGGKHLGCYTTDLSIQMASVVAEAKMAPTDDMDIPELELPHASTKSKEVKEVSLGLDDPSKTVKIGAHLDPK